MLRAAVTGRSEREPQRVGCWAVLTFASVPLCGGDESSELSLFLSTSPLTLLIGAACGPARPQFFYLFFYLCVWGLINVVSIPFCPIGVAPLEGRLAGQPPLCRCSPANSYLSFCQCLFGVSLGVAWRACFAFFALPLSFKHVTRAELLRFDSCPGPRQL